ncbi:MFS transporter [uncultured Clostridium sp.]|uniref:MFS transporter n=1 Tax=uncultured Clostridium sp. TaxID=59620 RepID=UPI0025959A86|nr:MFS transporter [uncultured Clostridium sp.]
MEMKKRWKIGVLLLLILLAAVFWKRNLLEINPFHPITADGLYRVLNAGDDGSLLITDRSGRRFYRVNQERQAEYILTGKRNQDGFFDAKQMYEASDGSLYVLDLMRDGSRKMEQERILQYDSQGKLVRTVAKIQYGKEDRIYKNVINRITELDGTVVWFQFTDDGFSLMGEEGELRHFLYPEAAQYLVDFEVNPQTGFCTYLNKNGEIYEEQADGSFVKLYGVDGNTLEIPWYMDYSADGQLYFADIGRRGIYRLTETGKAVLVLNGTGSEAPQELSKEEIRENPIYYNLDVGTFLTTTDGYGVIAANPGGEEEYLTEIPLTGSLKAAVLAVWVGAALGALALTALSGYGIYRICKSKDRFVHIVAGMLAGTLVLTTLFTMIVLKDWTARMTEEITDRTMSVSGLAAQLIPGDKMEKIHSIQDYEGEDYQDIRSVARSIFTSGNMQIDDLYCVIYRIQDGMITSMYSVEDYVGAIYPYDWAYEDSDEQHILETHEQMTYMGLSSNEGSFIFTNSPILNSSGEAVGIMEVGTDLYNFQQANRKVILEVMTSAVVLAVTMILIVSEILIFGRGQEKRKRALALGGDKTQIPAAMLRILVFLIFFVTNIPKAFLPIYIMKQAETESVLGLSPALLVSIALSAEVLFGALTSFGGSVVLRWLGRRKTAVFGSILFGVGLTMRALIPTIASFIIGNAVMGAGWGFLLLIVQVIIAEKNPEEKTEGFTGYTAASLSGVNCGVVFGAFLINWLNYQSVLMIIGVLSFTALLFSLLYIYDERKTDAEMTVAEGGEKKQALGSGMSTARFLLSPHVILYFIGIVIPVVAGGYFLAYLYPLLGENLGISETNIGYSYLLNGVCIICLGGFLTKQLTRRLGQKGSLALAAALYAGAFLIYAVWPGISTLMVLLVLLGASDSYGLPAQSTYYTDMKEVQAYGYDKAMGVYSLFENMSQVFGSFIFGIIYVNGVTVGLTIAGGVIFAAAVLFFLFGEKVDAGEESNA